MNAMRIALCFATLLCFSQTAAAEEDACGNHYILDRPPCTVSTAVPIQRQTATIWLGHECLQFCFFPDRITVEAGDSLTFVLYCEYDCGPHNVVADDGSFRCARGCDGEGGDGTPAPWSAAWTFTRRFNTPGVVKVHDERSAATFAVYVMADSSRTVVEFHNPDLGRYFITGDPGEQAYVDTGAAGRWQRTGGSFKASGPNQVCRFGGNTVKNPDTGFAYGPNSHFFTADAAECANLRATFHWLRPGWKFESYDFTISAVGPAGCPSHLAPVYRAYNRGFERGIESNHRITTDLPAYRATVDSGWIGEGVVMCALR